MAIRGSVDRRPGSEEANIIVNELFPLDELRRRGTKGVLIRLVEETHSAETLESLRDIIAEHPGQLELQLMMCLTDGQRLFLTSNSKRVELSAEFRQRVESLLGPGNVRAITAPPTASVPRTGNAGNNGRRAAAFGNGR